LRGRNSGYENRSNVLEIKYNSLDDGPAIGPAVFFKGCPLDCVWCHNPESKKRSSELSFDVRECIGCGSCIREGIIKRKKVLGGLHSQYFRDAA